MKYKLVKIMIDKYWLDSNRNGHEIDVLVPTKTSNQKRKQGAPKWFTEFVEKRFDPLAKDVASLKTDVADLKVRVTKIEDTLIRNNIN